MLLQDLASGWWLKAELFESGFIRCNIVEETDVPELQADDAGKRVVEQVE